MTILNTPIAFTQHRHRRFLISWHMITSISTDAAKALNESVRLLLKEKMIDKMKSGSVIFDLAVTQGGNAAYSEVDKIVDKNGKKIIGISNVMNKLPLTASNLYAKNLFSFVRNLYSREKKQFVINLEDEIIKNTLLKE